MITAITVFIVYFVIGVVVGRLRTRDVVGLDDAVYAGWVATLLWPVVVMVVSFHCIGIWLFWRGNGSR